MCGSVLPRSLKELVEQASTASPFTMCFQPSDLMVMFLVLRFSWEQAVLPSMHHAESLGEAQRFVELVGPEMSVSGTDFDYSVSLCGPSVWLSWVDALRETIQGFMPHPGWAEQ